MSGLTVLDCDNGVGELTRAKKASGDCDWRCWRFLYSSLLSLRRTMFREHATEREQGADLRKVIPLSVGHHHSFTDVHRFNILMLHFTVPILYILRRQNVSSRMSWFILTVVGLYSDDPSGSAPAVRRMSSTMRLLASRAGQECQHPIFLGGAGSRPRRTAKRTWGSQQLGRRERKLYCLGRAHPAERVIAVAFPSNLVGVLLGAFRLLPSSPEDVLRLPPRHRRLHADPGRPGSPLFALVGGAHGR